LIEVATLYYRTGYTSRDRRAIHRGAIRSHRTVKAARILCRIHEITALSRNIHGCLSRIAANGTPSSLCDDVDLTI
jgi:hypothetical protein